MTSRKDMLAKLQARRASQGDDSEDEMGDRTHGMSELQRQMMEQMTAQSFSRPAQQVVEKLVEVVPTGALVQNEDGSLGLGGFLLTGTGLLVRDDATFEDWQMVGGVLRKIESGLQWMLGDWLAYGERTYGETYQQVAETMGYETKTLYNFAYVCKGVDFSLRKEKLSFGHHNLVAAMSPDDQAFWLNAALDNGWSISKFRKAIRGELPQSEMRALTDGEPLDWSDGAGEAVNVRDDTPVQMPLFNDTYFKSIARVQNAAKKGIPDDPQYRRTLVRDVERVIEMARELLKALEGDA